MAIVDEKVAVVGFIFALLLAAAMFVVAVTVAPYVALSDLVVEDRLLTQTVVIAFRYLFPLPLVDAFAGSFAGLFLGSKLKLSDE